MHLLSQWMMKFIWLKVWLVRQSVLKAPQMRNLQLELNDQHLLQEQFDHQEQFKGSLKWAKNVL